jgi:DhnA family fructose-bisphosphate aldolase class Ia
LNTYRLNEFINPIDQRSLVVDTSASLVLGVRPGLEHFEDAVKPILSHADGVVTSPGQARHLMSRTRADAALLVRATWTNALRGKDFVLPPETIHYKSLLDASSVLALGASAAVLHFLLGYAEQIEADCLKQTVTLALDGAAQGLPLVVDVQPTGSRVVLLSKAIELGVSYAIEGGASGIVIPWPGGTSFQTIKKMAGDCPIWLKPADLDPRNPNMLAGLDMGATGLWLGESLFATNDPVATAQAFRATVHSQASATESA